MHRWPWFLYAAYLGVAVTGLLQHELWLDEAHHWLVARDSHSLAELFRNLRYEGHPGLWNLLLYLGKQGYRHPLMVQAIHLFFAAGMAALFVFRSPFPWWAKLLFPFGYFPLFEYGMISRNYAMACFLSFLFVALYQRRSKHYLLLGVVLALLANTHLLGLVLATLLFIGWWMDDKKQVKRGYKLATLIFIVGVVLAILQVLPPADHPMLSDLDVVRMSEWERIKRVMLVFWESFFPVPDHNAYHFWHTNWLESHTLGLARGLSVALFLMPLWFFRGKPRPLLLFYGMGIAVMLLCAFKNVNYARFNGFIFISFLLAGWLLIQEEGAFLASPLRRFFLLLVLATQLLAGGMAWWRDYQYPFSESKNAAAYLQAKERSHLPLMANYCFGEPLNAYLGPRLLYPEQPGDSFCHWQAFDKAYVAYLLTVDTYDQLIGNLIAIGKEEAILVHFKPLDIAEGPLIRIIGGQAYELRISQEAFFDKSIKRMENYYLYRLRLRWPRGDSQSLSGLAPGLFLNR